MMEALNITAMRMGNRSCLDRSFAKSDNPSHSANRAFPRSQGSRAGHYCLKQTPRRTLVKKILFAIMLIAAFSVFATGQNLTLRPAARGTTGSGGNTIRLTPPHACTVSKAHPCVYYGGDPNANDPELNAISNENTLFIPNSYTYTEVNVPVATSISASFSNNVTTNSVFDPKTATWFYRTGVSEGNGGTLICSGNSPAMFTPNDWLPIDNPQYEVLTTTRCKLPAGDVWFAVTPNCTNPNDPSCTGDNNTAEYWEWDTNNGPNAINGDFTVTSNTGLGPMFNSQYFGVTFGSWCNDEGAVCGDGMSAGILK